MLKLSLYWLPSRSDTKTELSSWEEIMSQDKSHKSMDFMINAVENMGTVMFGKLSLNSLITYPWLLLLRTLSFVYMEDFRLRLKLLITFDHWREFKKFHMRDQCATCFGRIQMTDQVGAWILEALATLLVRILQRVSTTLTTWKWLLVRINWWWR